MAAQPVQTGFEHAASAERLPSHRNEERQPAPYQRTSENSKQSSRVMPEQNPELLQWRANVLLDEMMLGAIDIAANDSAPARALSSRQNANHDVASVPAAGTNQRSEVLGRTSELAATDRVVDPYDLPGYLASSVQQPPAASANGEAARAEYHNGSYQRQPADGFTSNEQANQRQRSDAASLRGTTAQRVGAVATPANSAERLQPGNGTEQWLFAAEQRYQQLAARRQDSRGSAMTVPGYDSDGWSMAADRLAQQEYGVLDDPYSRENSHGQIPSYSTSATATTPSPTSVNRGGATRNGRKSLRSNLLPRMNALDSQTVQQEMAMLQSGIEGVLPVSHESRTRAQHLLQKAHAILQADPTRSAEVEYYLQQVRTIMHRLQETVHWSNLYQNRLRTYLLAWLALSAVIIVSRYLYAVPLSTWLARISGQNSDSLWVYNILTITSAFFFGALGGGIGALFNMIQHARLEHGFFDRKYGLRGLILPLIGALFGLSLCVIFGIIYAIGGIDPAGSLWFGLVPALLALAAGVIQEYLYGTRES